MKQLKSRAPRKKNCGTFKKKHKNKIINRILFKLYGTEPIYDTKHIYYIDGKIYMSPIMFDKIKETINNG